MANHSVYLPDGSDAAWTTAHRSLLRARLYWREGSLPTPSPPLTVLAPWGPTTERILWYRLDRPGSRMGGADSSGSRRNGAGICIGNNCGGAALAPVHRPGEEVIALAPAWLVAMENGFGLKGKHWLYGADPPPAVTVHYTCTTQTEAARIWPLVLFGANWHEAAVRAEVGSPTRLAPEPRAMDRDAVARAAAAAAAATAAAASAAPENSRVQAADALNPLPSVPRRLLALYDGTYLNPLPSRSWARLNTVHAVLGGLAALSGRILVAPVTNCTATEGRRTLGAEPRRTRRKDVKPEPGLSSRCFWHVHTRYGVRCVLRIGHCEEIAPPREAEEAMLSSRGSSPPVVTLDLTAAAAALSGTGGGSVIDALAAHASDRLVFVRLILPPIDAPVPVSGNRRRAPRHGLLELVQKELVEPRLKVAIRAFRKRCADLTSGPLCNNICS